MLYLFNSYGDGGVPVNMAQDVPISGIYEDKTDQIKSSKGTSISQHAQKHGQKITTKTIHHNSVHSAQNHIQNSQVSQNSHQQQNHAMNTASMNSIQSANLLALTEQGKCYNANQYFKL